jgi:transcription antitermination factor NusG
MQQAATAQQRPRRRTAVASAPHAVWYVVQACGRSDEAVGNSLKNLGFDVYCPRVLELRRLGQRQMSAKQRRAGIEISRPALVPMFPRYLFVRFDMGSWHELVGIGVRGLLCEHGLPVPVPVSAIDHIRLIERGGSASNERLRVVYRIGQEVRINSGPFREFHAVMQTALDLPLDAVDPATRVRVLLNLFGGSSIVELDSWQVEVI